MKSDTCTLYAPGPDSGGPRDGARVLRINDVRERTSLSVSLLYLLIARGVLPPWIPLGTRARGMLDYMLDAWLQSRLRARDAMPSLSTPVDLPVWAPALLLTPAHCGIRMLKLSEVEYRVGLARTHIYRQIEDGDFPRPAPLTEGTRRWAAHEIDQWIANRLRMLRRLHRNTLHLPVPSRDSTGHASRVA